MKNKLPISLENSPLVDAICEFRLGPNAGVTELLLGHIFSSYRDMQPILIKLPNLDLPQEIRSQIPDFAYQPLYRIDLGDFIVSVGDRCFSIATSVNYPSWKKFKIEIENLVSYVIGLQMFQNIERIGMKYINLIECNSNASVKELTNFQIASGNTDFSIFPLNLNLEVEEDRDTMKLLHISHPTGIRISRNHPSIRLPDIERSGLLIEVDIIRRIGLPISIINQSLDATLDSMHEICKSNFYSFLSENAVESMRAKYE